MSLAPIGLFAAASRTPLSPPLLPWGQETRPKIRLGFRVKV